MVSTIKIGWFTTIFINCTPSCFYTIFKQTCLYLKGALANQLPCSSNNFIFLQLWIHSKLLDVRRVGPCVADFPGWKIPQEGRDQLPPT